jgi:hypothetical protein
MPEYTVFPFNQFGGGLNLRDKADVVREDQAIDLLNVEFSEVGAIKQRDGYAELTASSLTNRVDSLIPIYKPDGTKQLLAGCGTRLEALNTSGAIVSSLTGKTSGPWSFVRFAAPGSEFAYAGNGVDTVVRWDGAAWSAPANMPKSGSLCALTGAKSNRLVSTGYGTGATSGPTASASNPSRVHFSDPGTPETWTANNFIDLEPGDGEQIMAAVLWHDRVFVFKESKFFVFGDESTKGDGTPQFDYYAVDTGVGLAARGAICAGREGIYFLSRQGVYVTNGGPPVSLSDIVEPFFVGNPEVYFLSSTLNQAQVSLARMTWHKERLFLSVPTGTATANDRTLVHDLRHGWWSVWDIPGSGLASWRKSDQPELHFGYAAGANKVGRVSVGSTDDVGAVITSRWRSGWGDYGQSVVKTLRESKLWGTGAVTCNLSKDFERSPVQTAVAVFGSGVTDLWAAGATASDVWGDGTNLADLWSGAGQVSPALVRKAIRGNVLSTEFVNQTGYPSWSIHRVSKHLRERRVPSVVGTER